ncbi:hypothetical protein ACPPVT_06855 [Angustibacter sp. McL0619]|uniref:hypothetical protein n=1 Tax=Angustibacter sp. McL0619 TaxID=3415676 RepID=UPI003CEA8216
MDGRPPAVPTPEADGFAADVSAALAQTLASPDLRAAFPDPTRLTARVLEHVPDLSQQQRAERAAVESALANLAAARSRERRWLTVLRVVFGLPLTFCLVYALIGLYGAFYAKAGLRLGWDPTGAILLPGDAKEDLAGDALSTLFAFWFLMAVIAGVYTFAARRIRRPAHRCAAAVQQLESVARAALQLRVEGLARRLANSEEFITVRSVVSLTTTTAPQLVEQDYAKDTIPGRTQLEVEDLIREHRTTAIGIAGPRGVGKTTIMRRLPSDLPDHVVVYVPVPVYYSAADFVHHVHVQVAQAVRDSQPPEPPASRGRLRRAAPGIGIAVAFLLLLGAVDLIMPDDPFAFVLPHDVSNGLLVLMASIAVLVSVPLGLRWWDEEVRERAEQGSPGSARQLAERQLRWLTYRSTLQTSHRWSLPLAKATFESSTGRTVEERELSHPDAVDAFRRFAREYGQLDGVQPLVVTVDELDKISDPQKAVELVNGAKDLLHIDGTHFVVSVSEEALAGYALRGLEVRDVFDSTFDVVLEVKPLSAHDSLALLERRVLDFPVPVGLLCHCVSGGLPRDLIRSARFCVGIRRADTSPVGIADLAGALTRSELIGALDAALRTGSNHVGSDQLLALRDVLEAGPRLEASTVRDVLGRLAGDRAAVLDVYAAFLATTYEYFATPRDSDQWTALIDDGRAAGFATALASVQRTIPVSASAAAARLDTARRTFDLSASATAVT